MSQPVSRRRLGRLAAPALILGVLVGAVPASPAQAQLAVFDPSNYAQNLLTAARSLEQINHQIQSLQNQATMILNQAKNLSHIDFPEIQGLNQALGEIDRLMGQAQAIGNRAETVDAEFRRMFPQSASAALTTPARVVEARARLDASRDALAQTVRLQAQVVGNIRADSGALIAIVAKSQAAEGALQVGQATNQLLALAAKQQFQIQSLMAAQNRAEALEASRRVQAEAEARAATAKFLGTGTAYRPR